ncbi:uncharacterized protein LOC131651122 [Vicia villosa]|uniref:uncharacterized protein LOC131651122 n=1 Tax=Vicia villosa TaxID=3911 RepID=UPI00273CE50C|nr:uncharacterized protein LOC131651122 [Vicia villosa]
MDRRVDIVSFPTIWAEMLNENKFSMSRVYQCLLQDNPLVEWRHLLCHNIARPRAKMLLWLVCQGRVATKERLHKMGMIQHMNCELCGFPTENLEHCMFKCKYAISIWSIILQWVQIIVPSSIDLNWIMKYTHSIGWKHGFFKAVVAETLYAIWTQRNKVTFDKDSYTLDIDRNTKSIIDALVYRGWMHSKYREKIASLLM